MKKRENRSDKKKTAIICEKRDMSKNKNISSDTETILLELNI